MLDVGVRAQRRVHTRNCSTAVPPAARALRAAAARTRKASDCGTFHHATMRDRRSTRFGTYEDHRARAPVSTHSTESSATAATRVTFTALRHIDKHCFVTTATSTIVATWPCTAYGPVSTSRSQHEDRRIPQLLRHSCATAATRDTAAAPCSFTVASRATANTATQVSSTPTSSASATTTGAASTDSFAVSHTAVRTSRVLLLVLL